ncbi:MULTISPECIES: acyl-CoA dehydrogenase family protein [unclassified Parafrankia]|uniref:acyl-CoA dehydrogenase family protein n=1 Tax=unclassified Parafrankia TaxID=2994368 RepID=UPI000DD44340|nr:MULTISPECIES: acyl-CoA dehydrogenase family protein [unclassified Parafrankia]TCJ33495.1 acyl-CoA dehydrogenase [Parafrankia sp. BMG5.11]
MPLDLPDEDRALRATVSAIAHEFGHRRYADCAADGQFPLALWERLAEHGFAGVNVPAEHSGGGGRLHDLMAVAEEVAAAGCPLMTLVVSPGLCAPILAAHGTVEQRRRWLPGIGSGRSRLAFAITEPDAGSNSHALLTHARHDGRNWRLQGQKYYISGVDDAEAMMVVARTGTSPAGAAQLSLFMVPVDARGVTYTPVRTHVLAAERQFTVIFDDVRLGDDHLVGFAGRGLAHAFDGLNPERIVSAATCVGIGRYALDKAVAYARERQVWGVPIGAHQAVAHPLARALVSLESARLLLHRAADLVVAGQHQGSAATIAKYAAAEAAAEALDAAIQVHGGNGMSHDFGLADLWGITRLYGIAPVSREMSLNHLAVHELGLPKSY